MYQKALQEAATLLFALGMADKVELTMAGETRELDQGDKETLKLVAGMLRGQAGLHAGLQIGVRSRAGRTP